MITLKIGDTTEEVDDERRLGEEIGKHLRLPLEYVRINDLTGEIQIKSPHGFKAAISFSQKRDRIGQRHDVEITLC